MSAAGAAGERTMQFGLLYELEAPSPEREIDIYFEALEQISRARGDRPGPVVVVLGRPSLAESSTVAMRAARALRDVPDVRFLSALRRGNVHGAIDAGLVPGFLPGRVTLDAGRDWFAEAWGGRLPDAKGLDAQGILAAAAAGKIEVLVILGADPVADFPDADLARRAIAGVKKVIAVGGFLTGSSGGAEVVLPAEHRYRTDPEGSPGEAARGGRRPSRGGLAPLPEAVVLVQRFAADHQRAVLGGGHAPSRALQGAEVVLLVEGLAPEHERPVLGVGHALGNALPLAEAVLLVEGVAPNHERPVFGLRHPCGLRGRRLRDAGDGRQDDNRCEDCCDPVCLARLHVSSSCRRPPRAAFADQTTSG